MSVKIDVFKKYRLAKHIVCGLVLKITSPKGVRTWNESTGLYHYNLHTDLKQVYDGQATELEDGLYWIVCIAKNKELGIHWNHYLLKVAKGSTELVESYLDVKSTDWIPEALPAIKQYFAESLK